MGDSRHDDPRDESRTPSSAPTPSANTAASTPPVPKEVPELAVNPLLNQPAPHGRGPGRPFAPGQSGNPAGRPPGSRNKLAAAMAAALEENIDALIGAALGLALDGNPRALKLFLDRVPVERERVAVELPKITAMSDILAANEVIVQAVGSGALSPEDARTIAGLLELQRRTIEDVEFETRLNRLLALWQEAEGLAKGKKR